MGRHSKFGYESRASGPKWKAGLYIRISKDDDDKRFSVENQKKLLSDFVDQHEDEFESVKLYVDSGASGSNSDRDAFTCLLNDLRESNINCIIVKDLSRLSRNYYEAGYYLEYLFVTLNVRFISLEYPALDSLKSPELMNNVLVPIQNVVNDDFCRQTSIKVKSILRMKMEKGEFIGSFAPFGYIKNPEDHHRLMVDEEAAHIVRQIYHWFVCDNMSQAGVIHKLNDLGIPTPITRKKAMGLNQYNPHVDGNDNSLWCIRTVNLILRNETYIGNLVQGRFGTKSYRYPTVVAKPKDTWVRVEGTHQAIITKDIFMKTQDLLSRDTCTRDKNSPLNLFAGFLRCAGCKRGMNRKASRGYVYYGCRTHYLSKDACTSHRAKESNLITSVSGVLQLFSDMLVNRDCFGKEVQDIFVYQPKATAWLSLIEQKQQKIDRAQNCIKALYPNWKNGDISKSEYHAYKTQYQNDIKQFKAEIQRTKEQQHKETEGRCTQNAEYESFTETGNLPELTRNLISELIDAIYIGERRTDNQVQMC